jgi:hypothetical protein
VGLGPHARGWAVVLTEMKRRTTTGGGSPLAWRFASFALGDQRTSYMTCGTEPPCHRLGTLVCIGGDFPWRFGARAGESAFKKWFISLAVVESELDCGPIFLMSW